MSKLSVLVGQELRRIDEVHDYHQLHFTNYLLNVFNSMEVEKQQEAAGYLQQVATVHETETEIRIILAGGTAITIDLEMAGWKGPEALALYHGNECIAVWT